MSPAWLIVSLLCSTLADDDVSCSTTTEDCGVNASRGLAMLQSGRASGQKAVAKEVQQQHADAKAPDPFEDLGAGCCSDRGSTGNFIILGNQKSLNACKEACLAEPFCGFIEYGWRRKGGKECVGLSKYASCLSLVAGRRDCGSRGDNGVHAYKLTGPSFRDFRDLGAGCCSDRRGNWLFDGGGVGDLNACKEKCLTDPCCGYIVHGWPNLGWCSVLSDVAACTDLDSGDTDCGSAGNTGVHTYKFTRPPPPTPANIFRDLGAGCCSDRGGNKLFDQGGFGDLNACKEKCLALPSCGYIVHGWPNWNGAGWDAAGTGEWCSVLSDVAVCTDLDSGDTDCGSAGNTGVHTYKFTRPPRVFRDLGAGCCSDRKGHQIFSEGGVGDLNACKEKCLALPTCRYIVHGWDTGTDTWESRWCSVLSDGPCCTDLDDGEGDCGSEGNSGVHTYMLEAAVA